MSKLTELSAARLPNGGGDLLIILAEPENMPASVIVHWPSHPTTIDPAQFRDAAQSIVALFSQAHIALSRIRSERL